MSTTRELWTRAWRDYRSHGGDGSPDDPMVFRAVVECLPRRHRAQLQAARVDEGLRARKAAYLHTHAVEQLRAIGQLRRAACKGFRLDRYGAIAQLQYRVSEVAVYREQAQASGRRLP